MLIDSHAHLYWESFKEDFDEVINRALSTGITGIINIGVDVNLSQKALEQVNKQLVKYPIAAYSTIGIHPHEAQKYSTDVSIHEGISRLEKIYLGSRSTVIAVGECGLDFAFEGNPDFVPSSLSADQLKDLQKKLFQSQIDLAKRLSLPLIIHVRDDRSQDPQNSECWKQVIEMSKDWYGVYHCYSGFPSTTQDILNNTDFLISFAATVTYPKNEYLRESVKMMPLEKILLETDCPFLPPQSKRGQRNEPSYMVETAQTIADIKGVSFEEVSEKTSENIKKLFYL